jgi:hypothetical protein
MFANRVEVTHLKPSGLTMELQILRIAANDRIWMNRVAPTHARHSGDVNMAPQDAILSNVHARANRAVRADGD